MKWRWFFSTRAGGDACGPSTMVFDYFDSFYIEVVLVDSKFQNLSDKQLNPPSIF